MPLRARMPTSPNILQRFANFHPFVSVGLNGPGSSEPSTVVSILGQLAEDELIGVRCVWFSQ